MISLVESGLVFQIQTSSPLPPVVQFHTAPSLAPFLSCSPPGNRPWTLLSLDLVLSKYFNFKITRGGVNVSAS